jgi:hypothetical protein
VEMKKQLSAQAGADAVREALFEPDTANATDNLEGALCDIERYREQGKPADDICVRTIRRVIGQLAKAEAALIEQPARETGND